MEISIVHEVGYQYSEPVYLEPQLIYLTPRCSFHLEVKDFKLEISPTPSVLSSNIDVEGNLQKIAHFYEFTDSFRVKSSFRAVSGHLNPFEFVVYPFDSTTIPLQYPKELVDSLQPYLQILGDRKTLKDYCSSFPDHQNLSLLDFINKLADDISNGFDYEYREEGNAMLPEQLLKSGTGTCRDFSNLYMQVCRHLGIAARFVSGYFHGDPDQARNLHGWVEVFIPGAGWRGVDPTQGVMTDDKYIALASSADTDKVAPVSGNFRGDAGAEMKTTLVMEASPD